MLTAQQQIIYDRYLELANERPFGSSIATAFKRGLEGHRSLAPKTSLAYAAWLAGRDRRKAKLAGQRAAAAYLAGSTLG